MFMRNLKYAKGHGNSDEWVQISEKGYRELITHFEKYAAEKGYNIPSYMEFIKNNVIKEVST